MPRTLSTTVQAAAAAGSIRTAHLFRAVFTNSSTGADETYYFTDNHRDVVFGTDTYQALGHLLGFEGLEENSDFQIATARVSLSGVDQSLVSSVLQYEYIDRALDVWRCFFTLADGSTVGQWNDAENWDDDQYMADSSATDQLMPDPVKIFSGRMAAPTVSEDPEAGTLLVSLTASSHFSDFDRRPGRHTNHSEQQAYFLGDRFFEGWGSPDQDMIWGRA